METLPKTLDHAKLLYIITDSTISAFKIYLFEGDSTSTNKYIKLANQRTYSWHSFLDHLPWKMKLFTFRFHWVLIRFVAKLWSTNVYIKCNSNEKKFPLFCSKLGEFLTTWFFLSTFQKCIQSIFWNKIVKDDRKYDFWMLYNFLSVSKHWQFLGKGRVLIF